MYKLHLFTKRKNETPLSSIVRPIVNYYAFVQIIMNINYM